MMHDLCGINLASHMSVASFAPLTLGPIYIYIGGGIFAGVGQKTKTCHCVR